MDHTINKNHKIISRPLFKCLISYKKIKGISDFDDIPLAIFQQSSSDGKGFKIGDENPMGYIEIVVNRAKQIPGPNAYGFADYPKKMKAVKFSDANVPSDVEWIMRRSREVPAADAYQNGNAFKSDTPAFSMGNFKPKSDTKRMESCNRVTKNSERASLGRCRQKR